MSRFHTTEFSFLPEHAFRPRAFGGMTLEGKDSAPAPDPRIGEAAGRQMALAEEQYRDFKSDYAPALKEQMAQGTRVAKEQNERQAAMQDYQLGRAKIYDDRWDNTQVPLENELIGRARAYNEEGEQERMAATAGADVNQAYANSGLMLNRDMARRGVNPSSGAALSMANQNSMARANAEASAMNKTRQAAKDMGWTRMGEAAALGRGLPGFGATSASLSSGAGMNAFSAGTAGGGIVGGASGASSAGYNAGGGMYSSAGGMLNQQYGTHSNNVNQSNNASAEVFGALAGAGIAKFSDRRLKQGIEAVGRDERTGLTLYEFSYVGAPDLRYRGVMADEVLLRFPEAVVQTASGFMAVDYAALGLEMVDVTTNRGN